MKNKIIEYLIAAVLIGAFDYLLFAFANWDLHPGNWGIDTRIGYVVLFCGSMAMHTAIKEMPK